MNRLVLNIESGARSGERVVIERTVEVGREVGAEGLLLPDAEVSRRHARLCLGSDGVWRVEDLGAANGTALDGVAVRAAPRPLGRSGVLSFAGRVRCLFHQESADVEDAPTWPGARGRATARGREAGFGGPTSGAGALAGGSARVSAERAWPGRGATGLPADPASASRSLEVCRRFGGHLEQLHQSLGADAPPEQRRLLTEISSDLEDLRALLEAGAQGVPSSPARLSRR